MGILSWVYSHLFLPHVSVICSCEPNYVSLGIRNLETFACKFCFWQCALLNTLTKLAVCLIWLPAQLFDLCATKFPVLLGACSNEKCWAGESQRLIIFLLLKFMWCIWGQLPPVCASAFLSAQCELSQWEEECMPGRLLPPHQTCPLPLPSLRLSFTMIHTQRDSSSCLFFSVYSLSVPLTISPPDTGLLLDALVCAHSQVYEHM